MSFCREGLARFFAVCTVLFGRACGGLSAVARPTGAAVCAEKAERP